MVSNIANENVVTKAVPNNFATGIVVAKMVAKWIPNLNAVTNSRKSITNEDNRK